MKPFTSFQELDALGEGLSKDYIARTHRWNARCFDIEGFITDYLELIDHIDVYEVEGIGKNRTQRVVIYYKFVGYLEIPDSLSKPSYSADIREGVAVEYITCEARDDILEEA